jgi:hypothetical protein
MTTTNKFDPTTRKALTKAIGDILQTKPKYLGMPSAAFQVGEYHLAKDGTLTGPENPELFAALAEAGFAPDVNECERSSHSSSQDDQDVNDSSRGVHPSQADEAPEPETPAEPETDCVCIEVPNDFTPEALDRLAAMVAAKEALIKKALNVDELPIQVLSDRIAFPWFTSTDGAEVDAYATFISALCKTAREKKRVTAKAPADGFENEAFAMRVFLIGLGLIGPEFKLVRALMGRGLCGSSAWRYGPPEKTQQEASAEEPAAAEETGE